MAMNTGNSRHVAFAWSWRRALLSILAMATLSGSAMPPLTSIPFWEASEGCWVSENSYLTAAMEPIIPSYASLTCIEVDQDMVTEREIKFYPAGELAAGLVGSIGKENEGVEVVTTTSAQSLGRTGAVRSIAAFSTSPAASEVTETVPLTRDTALATTRGPGDTLDRYRIFITLPDRRHRYLFVAGLVTEPTPGSSVGDLRGMAIFRQRRIEESEMSGWRDRLRKRFRVAFVVSRETDGRLRTDRLDGRR